MVSTIQYAIVIVSTVPQWELKLSKAMLNSIPHTQKTTTETMDCQALKSAAWIFLGGNMQCSLLDIISL